MLVSSRIAVCGQPPVSTPSTRSAGRASLAHEELGVLARVDVVRDHADAKARRAATRTSRSTSIVLPEPTGPPMPRRTMRFFGSAADFRATGSDADESGNEESLMRNFVLHGSEVGEGIEPAEILAGDRPASRPTLLSMAARRSRESTRCAASWPRRSSFGAARQIALRFWNDQEVSSASSSANAPESGTENRRRGGRGTFARVNRAREVGRGCSPRRPQRTGRAAGDGPWHGWPRASSRGVLLASTSASSAMQVREIAVANAACLREAHGGQFEVNEHRPDMIFEVPRERCLVAARARAARPARSRTSARSRRWETRSR